MASHKSAVKAARQAEKHRLANKAISSKLKTTLKNIRSVKTKAEGEEQLKKTAKMLDQLAAKGMIHKNKASNQKSKLTKFVKSIAA